jgi:hypothetical protein
MTMEFPVIVFGLCWLGKNEFVWNNKHNFLVKAAADVHSALQCTVDSWVCKVLIMGGSWEDHGRITEGPSRIMKGSWEDHGRIKGGSWKGVLGGCLGALGGPGGPWGALGGPGGPLGGALGGPLGAPTTTTNHRGGWGKARQTAGWAPSHTRVTSGKLSKIQRSWWTWDFL